MWLSGEHLEVLEDYWLFESNIITPKSEHANQSMCTQRPPNYLLATTQIMGGGGGGLK